ncbi:MAG: cyclase family protein [Firmicutes bacterium]|nr:cyclase family protein [Bacillota bacterium]
MKLYDVSMSIHEAMAVYKNREANKPKLTVDRDFTKGAWETRLTMNMHTGTHVDAPFHFLPDGEKIDTMPLDKVIRPCRLLDFTDVPDAVTDTHLKAHDIKAGDFIILKTRNSTVSGFDPAFVYLDGSGAKYLINKGVVGVGIDALSVERGQPDHVTHRTLLKEKVVIIEGLRLADVPAGEYLLLAAPLNIIGAEAAPARVVLVEGLGPVANGGE